MAFVGSGDQEAMNVLRVATADTVNNFGRLAATWVTDEQELDLHYQQLGSITTLALAVDNTTPNATPGAFALIMPVPNGIVHLFANCPHPYSALLRIR